MTGTEQVKAYLTAQLKQAGIQTVQAWERCRIPQLSTPAAVVGVEETRSSSAALWAYLGLTQEENAAAEKERYGRRLELSLCVDFYAPRAQAQNWKCAARYWRRCAFRRWRRSSISVASGAVRSAPTGSAAIFNAGAQLPARRT